MNEETCEQIQVSMLLAWPLPSSPFPTEPSSQSLPVPGAALLQHSFLGAELGQTGALSLFKHRGLCPPARERENWGPELLHGKIKTIKKKLEEKKRNEI